MTPPEAFVERLEIEGDREVADKRHSVRHGRVWSWEGELEIPR
jgi:hypothetical protein